MAQYVRQLRRRAQWHARRIGQYALGAVCLCVSLAFLTAAVWAYLATEFSPILASLACGGVFFLAAIGVFLVAGASRCPQIMPLDAAMNAELHDRFARESNPAGASGARPTLLEAFLAGYDTYMKLRKKHD